MEVKNKVEVRIAGKDYTLVGVESEEYIQKVALYIDKKMNEIIRKTNSLSTSMVAVLTSLNVADDYFKSLDKEKMISVNLSEVVSINEKLKKEKLELVDEKAKLIEESSFLNEKIAFLQLELAKREAELSEVRNSLEKVIPKPFNKPRLHVK